MFTQLKTAISSRIKFDTTPVKFKDKKEERRVPPARGIPKINISTTHNTDNRKKGQGFDTKHENKRKKETKTINKVVFTNCSGLHLGNNFTKVVNNNYSNKANLNDSVKKETSSDCKAGLNEESLFTTHREIPENVKETFNSIEMVAQSDFDIVKTFVFDWRKLKQRLCPYLAEVGENLTEEEIILFLLQEWIQANARSATVGMLCSDLWQIGEAQAAKKLAIAHSRC